MTTTYAATASGSTQKNPTGGAERLSATPARPASSVRRSTEQGYGELASRLVARRIASWHVDGARRAT